ncbi:hypothetical protein GCM10009730_27380 [Streptomyces albidochromogenes]
MVVVADLDEVETRLFRQNRLSHQLRRAEGLGGELVADLHLLPFLTCPRAASRTNRSSAQTYPGAGAALRLSPGRLRGVKRTPGGPPGNRMTPAR